MTNLDATFSALADPTRRAILLQLRQGETTALDLAKPFVMSQPAISRHLAVLEQAGLIESRVEGSKRPRRLSANALQGIDEWLNMLREALEANYNRLDRVLEGLTGPNSKDQS